MSSMWVAGIVGLAVGSFLNVLIDRLPKGETVVAGRSRCDHCGKTLRWFELIPLLSFFLQRGRCRRCHASISWQYPIVEAITGIAFWHGVNPLVFSSLLVIFAADLKYQIIPDSMVGIGLIGAVAQRGIIGQNILAGAAAAAFFSLLYAITRGRGMGLGDVKLAFLLGVLLGFPAIAVCVYLAFLTGAVVGVILMLLGKKNFHSTIAFGPFLILAAIGATLWGEKLIAVLRYLSF